MASQKKRYDSNRKVLRKGEYQTKKGYRYILKTAQGARIEITAPTLKKLREKEIEIKEKGMNNISFNTSTFYSHAVKCLKIRSGLKKSTQVQYSNYVERLKEEWLFKKKLKDIKSSDIKKWLIEKKECGLAQSSLNVIYTGIIKPTFKIAQEDREIAYNPATFSLTDVVQIPVKKRRALTKKEEEILRKYLYNGSNMAKNLKNLLIVILETGLRISEACALTIDDLDFENKIIDVNKQLCREKGQIWIDSLKTNSGYRQIPMSDECYKCLKSASLVINNKCIVDGVQGFVFHTKRNKMMDRGKAHALYYLLTREIDGLYGTKLCETTLHSLRHTFASKKAKSGCNPKALQVMLGHASISTTMDIYVEVDNNFILNEFNKG